MPTPCKNHRHVMLVSGGDNIIITNRSTWLNDSRRTSCGNRVKTITKGEECVGRNYCPT